MALGINSTFNYSEFLKITKKIDDIFARRIEVTAELFVNEGRLMLEEFRTRQKAAEHKPYKKGSKAAKRTVMDEDEKKKKMEDAIAYAVAHASGAALIEKKSPWINRTGRAFRGVHSFVEKKPESISVGLYHTMFYGAYLEFAYNRKYAVIEPIVRQHNPKLLEKVNLLFKGN
jgi:hypothetical protein